MSDTPKALAVWYLRAFNADKAAQLEQTKQRVKEYAAAQRITNEAEALAEMIEFAYDEYQKRKQQKES